ncbi:MAG: MarR family winged helix-turn-helix transcriptional regulator [Sphingobium sp.]
MKTKKQTTMPAVKSKDRPSAQQFTFGYLVHDVSRIRRTVMDQMMRPYDITRSQWSVLTTLSRGGNDGMMQVDLARLMEVGKVTVGGLVDRLEESGHVERRADATDRRAKRVFITEQGFSLISLMVKVASQMNQRVLSGATEEEVAICEKVLALVKGNLKEILVEQGGGGTAAEESADRIDALAAK